MLHPSTQKLIDRLAEMTETKKIQWAEQTGENVVYATEGYSVVLTAQPVELVIYSDSEKELERATVDQLLATPAVDGGTYSDVLSSMQSEALRFARGTETAISTLLDQLDTQVDGEEETADEISSDDDSSPLVEDETDDTSLLESAPLAELSSELDTAETSTVDVAEDTDTMTAAVARLADEVNERQDQLVAPVEVDEAAVASTEPEERSFNAEIASPSETNEPIVEDEAASAAVTAEARFQYVPFGLADVLEPAETIEDVSPVDALPTEDDSSNALDMPVVLSTNVMSPGLEADTLASVANDDSPEEQVEHVASAFDDAADTIVEAENKMITPSGLQSVTGIGVGTGLSRAPEAEPEVPEDTVDDEYSADAPQADETPTERIIIDATDDVIDAADDIESLEPEHSVVSDQEEETNPVPSGASEAATESAEDPSDSTEEDVSPIARPRFNPWS